ncbi:HAD family phosphatase [Candidatus Woesearchaeota archaeon]|nr:HAD family phosphatase [Candidatus Woesearchaeota archaeon]
MRSVIFDFDGVIADTFEVAFIAFRDSLKEKGYDLEKEFLRKRFMIGLTNVLKEFFKEKDISYDEKMISEIAKRKTELQTGVIGSICVFPGVKSLLDALEKAGFSIAIASGNNISMIKSFLNEKGLNNHFKAIVSEQDVINQKPNPDIFLKAAENLGNLPECCTVIEDSTYGIRAAKKAGMESIAVTTGPFTRQELEKEKPGLLLDALEETGKIINFLEG